VQSPHSIAELMDEVGLGGRTTGRAKRSRPVYHALSLSYESGKLDTSHAPWLLGALQAGESLESL